MFLSKFAFLLISLNYFFIDIIPDYYLFNMNVSDSALTLGGLTPIFPSSTNTQFPSLKAGNHSSHISNILVNSQIKQYLTGYKNIVSKGITHLAIPNGWSWGGPVSSNCPIWMELFLARKSENSNL